jgi:multiple antibiotic resistance protein
MLVEKYIRDALMLWTTIDPIGTLSLFAALTAGLTEEIRKKTALKAILYATAILVGSIVIGQILLGGLGVQLVSLQIAGGIILFLFGLQMIFGTAGQPSPQAEQDHDLAVFPLAVPSIASPGAIMAIIVLTDNHMYSVPTQAGTTLILLIILAVTYVFMLAATPILRVIGKNGAGILVRVMGMILAALSVELVLGALGLEKWTAGAQVFFS